MGTKGGWSQRDQTQDEESRKRCTQRTQERYHAYSGAKGKGKILQGQIVQEENCQSWEYQGRNMMIFFYRTKQKLIIAK